MDKNSKKKKEKKIKLYPREVKLRSPLGIVIIPRPAKSNAATFEIVMACAHRIKLNLKIFSTYIVSVSVRLIKKIFAVQKTILPSSFSSLILVDLLNAATSLEKLN